MFKNESNNPQSSERAEITHSSFSKMKASDVRRLPKSERERYMLEHTAEAAKEYRDHPELLIDGGSEILDY